VSPPTPESKTATGSERSGAAMGAYGGTRGGQRPPPRRLNTLGASWLPNVLSVADSAPERLARSARAGAFA
jgi:hypothetical protein